eukprot:6196345-Pleurochrysis_carterae.AAC.4
MAREAALLVAARIAGASATGCAALTSARSSWSPSMLGTAANSHMAAATASWRMTADAELMLEKGADVPSTGNTVDSTLSAASKTSMERGGVEGLFLVFCWLRNSARRRVPAPSFGISLRSVFNSSSLLCAKRLGVHQLLKVCFQEPCCQRAVPTVARIAALLMPYAGSRASPRGCGRGDGPCVLPASSKDWWDALLTESARCRCDIVDADT